MNTTTDLQTYLVDAEQRFGGKVSDVARNKVSTYDPRSPEQLKQGGMIGGDRMSPNAHNYAPIYAKYLQSFIDNPPADALLAEVGILKGNGLATWCDLFASWDIFGFDIDLGHFLGNRERLESLGAFTKNSPQLFEFDQFVDNTAMLAEILGARKFSVVIDDGFHANETILTTFESMQSHLAEHFVYFAEDNPVVHTEFQSRYGDLYQIESVGLMTVLSRGVL